MLAKSSVLDRLPRQARICLGVPTCRRPTMLRQCLNSIHAMSIPDGVRLETVVVDNDAHESAREIVEAFAQDDINCHGYFAYLHEPNRGLSNVRNRIIDHALKTNARWIVMVDDDQIVQPSFLEQLLETQKLYNCDVVKPTVEYVYPSPLPFWAASRTRPHRLSKDFECAANGVLFSAMLVDPDYLALRFDLTYNFSGGEDRDFFQRARRQKVSMVRTPDIIIREEIPESKLTLSAQFSRKFYQSWVRIQQDMDTENRFLAISRSAPKIANLFLQSMFFGLIAIAISPLLPRQGRAHALRAVKRFGKSAGFFTGVTTRTVPIAYGTIHGH